MVTFMRGREGTLRASAGRSILRRFSASERPAAGHRAGRCRTIPSQGSRSKGSSRDIKRNMYRFSARISTCGRRADRATSGPLRGAFAASAADRNPGRDHICFMLEFMSRLFGATPLRRGGSAAAGAVPGRMPLRGLESPQDRPPGRGAQYAFTASHECVHHRVTSSRTLVMGSNAILIGYTHISTTTAASRRPVTSLRGARPDRPTSA